MNLIYHPRKFTDIKKSLAEDNEDGSQSKWVATDCTICCCSCGMNLFVEENLIRDVKGNFYTEEAKRIVQERIVFLRTFSDRLKKELAGEE